MQGQQQVTKAEMAALVARMREARRTGLVPGTEAHDRAQAFAAQRARDGGYQRVAVQRCRS